MAERIRKKKTTQDDFKHWEGYIMPKRPSKETDLPLIEKQKTLCTL